MPAKPLRLDAIIRVSQQDGREGDSFRSPEQQREACQRWADANHATIVSEHAGIDRSGKTMDRADVNAALERIRAGQSDGVIVAWLDRFGRAPVREALAVYDDIKQAGGQVVAADMAGLDPRDPTGEMALTVMLAVARMTWRKTAERYAQNRREAIAEGKAIGGAVLGYRFADPTPKGNGRAGVKDSHLVVHEAEKTIVRELFERKAGGATWLELTRWLDAVAPKANGGHWARSTVADLIGRRVYLGEVHHGEYRKAGAHDALVSPALWRRAQQPPGRRTPRGTYLLSGLARCAGCGRRMRGSALGRGARRIYTCATTGCSASSTITCARLDDEVVRQMFGHLDAFTVRAVDDAELAAARTHVEERNGVVERLAAVVPSHPTAVAAHQAALADAERALNEAEDRADHLAAAAAQGGPDVRELREDWSTMTLEERREILRAGIDAVLVRRATSRHAPHPPVGARVLVLFAGDAPGELASARSGPVMSWAWDDHPRSLVAAA